MQKKAHHIPTKAAMPEVSSYFFSGLMTDVNLWQGQRNRIEVDNVLGKDICHALAAVEQARNARQCEGVWSYFTQNVMR